MKKRLIFGLALAGVTAAAAALRYWQRTSAFEPDTGLLTPGAPATWCLVGLTVLAAAGLIPLVRWALRDGAFRSYLTAFALPGRALLAVYLAAGGLLLAAGLLGIQDHRLGQSDQVSRYVFSIALVPTGLDLALVGWLGAQRQEGQGRFAWPLLLPGWCGCAWLISAYQAHTAQPGAMSYALYFLGAVCAAVGCYLMASFSFERPRPFWCAWTCGMGLVLLATAAVDALAGGDVHQLLVCLGFMLYLAGQTACLVYRSGAPAELEPWTPPDEVETEVSDHE